jgi:hypothetical protein
MPETHPAVVDMPNDVAQWEDAHRYTPAPRHRRRILLDMMETLDFRDCLDAGCAQPFLIEEIVRRFRVEGFGCDISAEVMESSRRTAPGIQFAALDLTRERWPGGRQFDLVVSSEVLEHIADWPSAVKSLVAMTRKHLLITVPGGKVRAMDRIVGHYFHFQGPELVAALEQAGCTVTRVRRWGFPVHSLYKRLISALSPETLYQSFSGGSSYSISQRFVSHILYCLFYMNVFNAGDQIIILAEVGHHGRPKGQS